MKNAEMAKARFALERSCLRLVKKQIRTLEREFSTNYIAFRLGIPPTLVADLLSGKIRMSVERFSDLLLALGCEPQFVLRKIKRVPPQLGGES